MNWHVFAGAVIIAALGISSARAAEGPNLVPNGDFEQGTKNWSVKADYGKASFEKADGPAGPTVARLTPTNSLRPHLFFVQQGVAAPPAGKYVIRARIRFSDDYAARMPIVYFNITRKEGKSIYLELSPDKSAEPGVWHAFEKTVDVPADVMKVYVQMMVLGSIGHADFDGIELRSMTEAAARPAQSSPPPLRLFWSWGANEHPEWCARLRELGYTSVNGRVPLNERWWTRPRPMMENEKLLEEAGRQGMGVYVQLLWSCDLIRALEPHAVARDGGEEKRLSCPLSEPLWRDYVIPQFVAAAQLSCQWPALRGVILDVEQYASRVNTLDETYCYCDRCFGQFFKERKLAGPLPAPKERLAWLEKNGQQKEYFQSLESRTRTLAAELWRQTRTIQPDFELLYYNVEPTWFHTGFAAALADDPRPLYLLDERTYSGYSPGRGQEIEAALKKANPHAVWAPGFWTRMLDPRMMRLTVRRVLAEGRPLWIYNQQIPLDEAMLEAIRAN